MAQVLMATPTWMRTLCSLLAKLDLSNCVFYCKCFACSRQEHCKGIGKSTLARMENQQMREPCQFMLWPTPIAMTAMSGISPRQSEPIYWLVVPHLSFSLTDTLGLADCLTHMS
eukprot:6491052-Amphidinium_carterae.1